MSVLKEEVMALLEAIQFARAKGWGKVIFESDYSTLVNALSTQPHGASEFYAIVSVIKNQLSINFNFEVKFIRWQASMASHQVFEYSPTCIEPFLHDI